jgi:DNA replication and repair protein RecF
VEHGFIEHWRRFRRVLRQRNAALKTGGAAIAAWSRELVEAGEAIDAARRRVLELSRPSLEEQASGLLGGEVRFEYRPGWPAGANFADSLDESVDRDRQAGSTQVGPHRADLRLVYDERQARRLVSRGQQKLLACSMVLAASDVIQTALEEPLLLLLDDPSAELDQDSLARLVDHVGALGCQVIATSLTEAAPVFRGPTTMFHVEQGDIRIAERGSEG